eukprot:CAMPEP_0172692532 /NCGR_PEP_ID=MMETSP1074-20121228/25324_1 /TAXON_ID=2916 /ORGANISM="Ceratium fusus, Strain PA161109" /LENGTH=52 /DNA_ID=CAMNT_0013512755 /DNA_START=185 /DNA_END=343 /DNA_ORIENTATION=-
MAREIKPACALLIVVQPLIGGAALTGVVKAFTVTADGKLAASSSFFNSSLNF